MAIYNYPAVAVQCFYTKIMNISTKNYFFGFLPPHGRTIASFEQFMHWGTLEGWMQKVIPNQRKRRSFEKAIGTDGVIAVLSTPAPHVESTNTGDVLMLSATGATGSTPAAAMVDPCWGNYASSTNKGGIIYE